MRCDQCQKFVSFDEGNVDECEAEINGDMIEFSGRIVLPCAECGQELKELSVDGGLEILPQDFEGAPEVPDEEQYELLSFEAEYYERTETKDRNGKPIKSARYMKTFKGVTFTCEVKMTWKEGGKEKEQTGTITHTIEEPASAFESLI